jgi:hypothetical protein
MAGIVEVLFRVNNAAVKTGFEEVKNRASALRGELTTMFAGAFAFGAIVTSLKSVSAEFDRIQKLGQRFGDPVEDIQRLGHAASLAGADVEKVATAIGKATKAAADAVDGNEKLAKAFADLGIDAGAFVNMSLEDKLVALSAGFENVEGSGNKLRIALEVLGKSGAELLPFLLQGPEALRESMESAAVATQDQIDKMAELNDRLEIVGQNVRTTLGQAFVWLVERVEDAGSYIGAFLAVLMERIEQTTGVLSKLVSGDFKGAADAVGSLISSNGLARIGEIAQGDIQSRQQDREAAAANREEERQRSRANRYDPEAAQAEVDDADKKAEAEARKAEAAAEAEARKAEADRLAKEQTLLSLRQKLADQEFDKLTREEKILALLNEANNLAADRGENEEDRLRRQIRLNEVGVELSRLQFAKDREKQSATMDEFRRRESALGFASGMQVVGADSGLLGVNYNAGAIEQQKQIDLQREMAAYLKEIAQKEFIVSLPAAD